MAIRVINTIWQQFVEHEKLSTEKQKIQAIVKIIQNNKGLYERNYGTLQ